ncbi:hypothetical protein [Actinokineospora iranica]|nr:hypothetical protein [Actinokineospora iranica]
MAKASGQEGTKKEGRGLRWVMGLLGFGIPLLAVPAILDSADGHPAYAAVLALTVAPVLFIGLAALPHGEAAWPFYGWLPGAAWLVGGLIAVTRPATMDLGWLATDYSGTRTYSVTTMTVGAVILIVLGAAALAFYLHVLRKHTRR